MRKADTAHTMTRRDLAAATTPPTLQPNETRALAGSATNPGSAPHPDAELLTAARDYHNADSKYEACLAALPPKWTFDQHAAATGPHEKAGKVALGRLIAARPTTLEGFRAKAAVLRRPRETECLDGADPLTASLIRDLIDLPDPHSPAPDSADEASAAARAYLAIDASWEAFAAQVSPDWKEADYAVDAQYDKALAETRERLFATAATTLAACRAKALALRRHREMEGEDDDDAFTESLIRDLVELPDTGAVV